MSRSHWFAAIALGIVVAVLPPNEGGSAEQPNGGETQQAVTGPAAEAVPPVQPTDEPPGYTDPCNKGEDNRNSDLCAQWKAADAAQESAKWTRRSFWIGLAGTGIGGLTLFAAIAAAFYARDAAKHAGAAVTQAENATKAANDTVDVTRDIGARQLRAYLTVRAYTVVVNNAHVEVKIVGQNTGQTPALNVTTWTVVALQLPPFDEDWLNEPRYPTSKSDIGSGGDLAMDVYGPNNPTENLIARLRSGVIGCWVYGWVWYEDIFGEKHETMFRFVLLTERDHFVLRPAETGNKLT